MGYIHRVLVHIVLVSPGEMVMSNNKVEHIRDLMAMDEAAELAEFENMPTMEVYNMEWQAWYAYQLDMVKSAEEVTNV